MAKNKGSKASKGKSQKRILDAFQLAEKAERRNAASNGSDYGSSEDEDEFETKKGVLNARRLLGGNDRGGDGDDEEDEFEDEELDSDEALGSDDDFDILNSKFSQTIRDKAKARKQKGYVSDSEEEEEEEEGYTSIDEDDLMPLSAVWDLDDQQDGVTKKSKDIAQDNDIVLKDDIESSDDLSASDNSETGSEDEEEEEESEDEEIFAGFSGSEDEEEIELNSVKKSLAKEGINKRERKKLNNLNLEENEYNLPTNGQQLSLADMMSGVDDTVAKEAILIDSRDDSTSSQSTTGNKALSVPLPQRIQQRNERQSAYEIQVEEVNKWEDTVKENRRAEVLSFPLNKSNDQQPAAVTSFDPTTKPMTELEHKVNAMLEQSALLDTNKESQFEEIASANLSKDELRKRQNELRLMRELMFREEKKAKRIKKIKSKTYHKIKKKEMRRNQDLVEGEESDEEDHDIRRAKERMSLKHKNQSDWAKSMIKSGMSKDAETRAEMEEMLRQGERLRSRIMGHNNDEGEESEEDVKNLSDLEKENDNDQESEEENVKSKLGKGVMAMDFMKNAEKRAKLENAKNLDDLRKFKNDEGALLEEFENDANSINVERNEGRRVYAPSANAQKGEVDAMNKDTLRELEIDESKNLINRLSTKPKTKSHTNEPAKKSEKEKEEQDEDEANPWLSTSGKPVKSSSKIAGVVNKDSSKFEKAQHQINKKKRSHNTASGAAAAADDAVIDMDQTLNVVDAFGGSDNEQGEGNDDNDVRMFRQKDLIKEAFAGDDVITEFEKEKKDVEFEEGDQEVDVTLPGWGDWAGGNNKKSKKRKIVKKINGVVEDGKRKDKHLKNVIINEKVNKKNARYQSNGVPYPFETMEQYERSLRMPIGQEWMSRETHQRMTMPRVIAKHGSVIDPLKAPFK